ncbi:hypothetical protein BDZ94DRAFT_1315016 [Collybia nuda]|uniref:Uncharacterized protein n=1 Tax=Collybia nuda TaxID=64659 RepID=A0A9P6C8T2_9AGAR|nr:hypothetical protein BDZ94DRAFT_1316069 [Collybia nuda]KAF9456591.1 hypothetical protein BDZ94DRAFT_1315016 [Collybia nuda]
MGRPRIYHTPDEIRAANRAKSKRHYDKSKLSIAMKRGVKDCDKHRRSLVTYARASDAPPSPKLDSALLDKTSSTYWSSRVTQVERTFNTLIGESSFQFINGLCTAFHSTTYDKNTLRDPLLTVTHLRTRVRRYQDHILQENGVGIAWKKSKETEKKIGHVCASLEEALCLAEIGVNEFATCHAEGNMYFQINRD